MNRAVSKYMHHWGSTLILRGAVAIIGLVVAVGCASVLPAGLRDESLWAYHPIIVGMYATAVPFFAAIYKAFRLLGYIDKGEVFTGVTLAALRYIRYCAVVVAGAYIAGLPYIYVLAERDDAPGGVALGVVIVFASVVIATSLAVFEKLLKTAIAIKAENDLTV